MIMQFLRVEKPILSSILTVFILHSYASPVSKYMVKKVITATVSHTLQSVCKAMYDNNIGSIVIVKKMTSVLVPVGIITERDIVKIIGSTDLFIGMAAIRDFMSTPLVTVSSNTTISSAIDIMNAKKIRRLPITQNKDGDKLVGIISNSDILKAIGKIKKN
jgi:CBS domain-containing protein